MTTMKALILTLAIVTPFSIVFSAALHHLPHPWDIIFGLTVVSGLIALVVYAKRKYR